MIKRALWILIGAAGALQLDRWMRQRRAQLTPNALFGALLDAVNRRLEGKQGEHGS